MALIRFGMWEQILEEPVPEDPHLFAAHIAVAHYARGMAYAALGHVFSSAGGKNHLIFSVVVQIRANSPHSGQFCLSVGRKGGRGGEKVQECASRSEPAGEDASHELFVRHEGYMWNAECSGKDARGRDPLP